MKKFYTFWAVLIIATNILAQSPEKISYQAVIRDADDYLVTQQQVGMQISVLQGSENGTVVYMETQTPIANMNGLVSLEIGAGATSDDFAAIDWAAGPYFIKTEIDPAGETNYTIAGISQILSVPYALHAKTADIIIGDMEWDETDPTVPQHVKDILPADITNWNDAHQWGDHADAGYLTDYNETDPSVPAGTQAGDMQYWDGSAWVVVEATANEGATLQMIGGVPTWVGGTSPIGSVTNPITGEIWMDRNLGAMQVATSINDANAFGDLYQWGRGTDGHEQRTSGTTTTLSNTDSPGHDDFIVNGTDPFDWRSPQNNDLWQGVNGINNPCPDGYRLPTAAEWTEERQSWSSNDANGAFDSPLKLTTAGGRHGTTGLLINEEFGYYWSSTLNGGSAQYLRFGGDSDPWIFNFNRTFGCSVRCIKD